jgi:signal transduction histidine kinase
MMRRSPADDGNGVAQSYVRCMHWPRLVTRRPNPTVIDITVALIVCVVAELEMAFGSNIDGPAWVNAVAAAGITLPIALRRRWPLGVALAIGVVLALQEVLNGDLTENSISPLLAFPIAVYALAAYCDRRRAIAGLVGVIALVWTDVIFSSHRQPSDFLFTALLMAGPWLVGRIVATRVELAAELRDKADRLEREQEKQAELAVSEERARIARELHDVVAHNVSVMVVQAAAARRMIDHDPVKATEALGSVEQTGREALKEMRRMVGMLGKSDDKLALEPQPSVAELDWLIERAREEGLDVDLTIEGDERRLESSVDLSAFRIVQEALRNTLQHAGPARAHVLLRYGEHDVEVDVHDDGRGARPAMVNGAHAGTGIVGMRERVAMLGGEIEAGYRKDGGFGVRAKLPLEREDH